MPVPGGPRKSTSSRWRDEAGGGELVDQRAVHLLVEVEIEGVERAVGVAKARLLEAPVEEAILAAQQLVADERGDEVERRLALGLRLAEPRFEDVGHAGEAELAQRAIEFDEVHVGVSCRAIDEIAVEGELADERIDLAERERRRRPALEIAAQEAIGRDAEVERGLGGVVDGGRAVLLGEREDAEDAPDAGGALVVVDVRAQTGADAGPAWRARASSASVVAGVRAGRSASCDAMPAARRAHVLAQELPGRRVEERGRGGRSTAPGRAGRSSRAAPL